MDHKKKRGKKETGIGVSNLVYLFILLVLMIFVVGAVSWVGHDSGYQGSEDVIYLHNLSANISDPVDGMFFSIDDTGGLNLSWNDIVVSLSAVSSWIFISDSSDGIFVINTTRDNQSGHFKIPFKVTYGGGAGVIESFNFTINATNDAPEFSLETNYTFEVLGEGNISEGIEIIGEDEELHYPLRFNNITFFDNCELAEWSTREGLGKCDLDYNFTNEFQDSNQTVFVNFTNLVYNDVGIYPVRICVNDTLPEEGQRPLYRTQDYNFNQTYCENTTLILRSSLYVNVSECNGTFTNEDNLSLSCNITIYTQGQEDDLIISSNSSLKNSTGQGWFNQSWFYGTNSSSSSNFQLVVQINVSLGKSNVGNWTINFSVEDVTSGEIGSSVLDIFVNRSVNNSLPEIVTSIANIEMSINQLETIYFNITDDDLSIPDKILFNESFSLNYSAINLNGSGETEFSSFSITGLGQVNNTNIHRAKIEFYPNSTEYGNFTINLSVTDYETAVNFTFFNLTILSNIAPEWNQTSYYFEGNVYSIFNDTNLLEINLSEYISDGDGDDLNFSYINLSGGYDLFNETTFNSSIGGINLTLWKPHAGVSNYNISSTDGYLTSTATFIFNITNDPATPNITQLKEKDLAVIEGLSVFSIYEGNVTVLDLYIEDLDFLIEQKSFYNESISISTTIENNTFVEETIDFDFVISRLPGDGLEDNQTEFRANFTSSKKNIGNYTVTINATDKSNLSSALFVFNLSIIEINNYPNLLNVINFTSAVGRTISYQFEANDSEDGNSSTEGNTNFNFSVINLSGTNLFSETTFNFTTGVFNISLNQSHAGKHQFSFIVNDSEGLNNTKTFWIYVYDVPNVTLPVSGYVFNGTENTTITFNITANHSVADNLTYVLFMDRVICNDSNISNCNSYEALSYRVNQTGFGNGTNVSFVFTPNFSDESYSSSKNLTLVVYSANANLINASQVNTTQNFKINITHLNAPMEFIQNISDLETTYNLEIELDLKQYFSDEDFYDSFYGEIYNYNFTIASNFSSSNIHAEISDDWVLTLSTIIVGETTERLTINATDLNESNESLTYVLSNEFEVQFVSPDETIRIVTSSSSSEIPISLKIIVPDPISSYSEGVILVPIKLQNDGKTELKGINLSSMLAKNGEIVKNVKMLFGTDYFSELRSGEIKETLLTIELNLSEVGLYEVTINASVRTPKYFDWGKIQIIVQERDQVFERIIFAEELIAENPECLEIRELIAEARRLYASGKLQEATLATDSAIQSCRDAVSQSLVFSRKSSAKSFSFETNTFNYLVIAMFFSIILGISYYYARRFGMRNDRFKKSIGLFRGWKRG